MNTLNIKNFLILHDVKLSYNDLLVIIGPQAQGKSLISKLIYFFESIPKDLYSLLGSSLNKRDLKKHFVAKFLKIFSSENIFLSKINITFESLDFTCSISSLNDKKVLDIDFDESFWKSFSKDKILFVKCKSLRDQYNFTSYYSYLSECNEDSRKSFIDNYTNHYLSMRLGVSKGDQADVALIKRDIVKSLEIDLKYSKLSTAIYVPAGRSFFANLQKAIFNFLTQQLPIEYFLKEFGALYENMKFNLEKKPTRLVTDSRKSFESACSKILGGTYVRTKDRDYLKSKNGQLINMEYASSGQQEALPLLMAISSITARSILIIEEPEAHLYPTAQSEVIKLMGRSYNLTECQSRFVVTTHSPYVLVSINNLLEAFKANFHNIQVGGPAKDWLSCAMDPKRVSAYLLSDGKIKSIMDQEEGLILAEEIDAISSTLNSDFEALLGS